MVLTYPLMTAVHLVSADIGCVTGSGLAKNMGDPVRDRIDWSPLDPIKALFWSAVINGIVAVPIMVAMMMVASRYSAMGKFKARPQMLFFGWTATAVMAAAAVAMIVVR